MSSSGNRLQPQLGTDRWGGAASNDRDLTRYVGEVAGNYSGIGNIPELAWRRSYGVKLHSKIAAENRGVARIERSRRITACGIDHIGQGARRLKRHSIIAVADADIGTGDGRVATKSRCRIRPR